MNIFSFYMLPLKPAKWYCMGLIKKPGIVKFIEKKEGLSGDNLALLQMVLVQNESMDGRVHCMLSVLKKLTSLLLGKLPTKIMVNNISLMGLGLLHMKRRLSSLLYTMIKHRTTYKQLIKCFTVNQLLVIIFEQIFNIVTYYLLD